MKKNCIQPHLVWGGSETHETPLDVENTETSKGILSSIHICIHVFLQNGYIHLGTRAHY